MPPVDSLGAAATTPHAASDNLSTMKLPNQPGDANQQRAARDKHDVELEEADMATALEAMAPHLKITTDAGGTKTLAFAAAADLAARRAKIKSAALRSAVTPVSR